MLVTSKSINNGVKLVSTQIILEGNIDESNLERIERIVLLQLGTMAGRFASLRVVVSEGSADAPLAYQCKLTGTQKNGARVEVSMVNSGLHVCVADAVARLVREVRRATRETFRPSHLEGSNLG